MISYDHVHTILIYVGDILGHYLLCFEMKYGSVENKVLNKCFLDEFEGTAITMLDPDTPTAAASLIKRSKPAELPLFSPKHWKLA